MDFGLSSVERYLPSSRLVYRQKKLPKTLIYSVPEALVTKNPCIIRVNAQSTTRYSKAPAISSCTGRC